MNDIPMSRFRKTICAGFLVAASLCSTSYGMNVREVELAEAPTSDMYFMGTLVGSDQADLSDRNRSIVLTRDHAVFPTGNKKKPTCSGDFKVMEQGTGKAFYMVLDPNTHSLAEGERAYPFQYRVIKFQKSACPANMQTWMMKVRLDNPRIVETKIYSGAYGPNEPFKETSFTKVE